VRRRVVLIGEILGLAAVDVELVDDFLGAVERGAGDETRQVVGDGFLGGRIEAAILVDVVHLHGHGSAAAAVAAPPRCSSAAAN
jgi:hypothetical protein